MVRWIVALFAGSMLLAGCSSVAPPPPSGVAGFDPLNANFPIEGEPVTLRQGVSTVPSAPGSASSVVTRALGPIALGDFTNDNRDDIAFVVTQERGGSGLFYYVVAALNSGRSYKTTGGFLLGDRIALRALTIPPRSGLIQVRYAEHAPGEPLAATPTAEVVVTLKVTPDGVLAKP